MSHVHIFFFWGGGGGGGAGGEMVMAYMFDEYCIELNTASAQFQYEFHWQMR